MHVQINSNYIIKQLSFFGLYLNKNSNCLSDITFDSPSTHINFNVFSVSKCPIAINAIATNVGALPIPAVQ